VTNSKRFLLHLFFLMLGLIAWLLIPHFLGGIAFWTAMLVAVLAFAWTSWLLQDDGCRTKQLPAEAEKAVRRWDVALHMISISGVLVTPFLGVICSGMGGLNHWLATVCLVWTVIPSLISMILWLIVSGTDCQKLFHGNRLLGIHMASMALMLLFMFDAYTFGAQLTVRKIGIILFFILVVGMFATAHFRPEQNNQIGTFWGSAFFIAVSLFSVLNVQLDTSAGESHAYTVIEVGGYHDSAVCQMDDGTVFQYSFCPLEEGETAWLYVGKGWFCERYFLDIEEPGEKWQ
jgi:uncharacterized membrane protein YhdT